MTEMQAEMRKMEADAKKASAIVDPSPTPPVSNMQKKLQALANAPQQATKAAPPKARKAPKAPKARKAPKAPKAPKEPAPPQAVPTVDHEGAYPKGTAVEVRLPGYGIMSGTIAEAKVCNEKKRSVFMVTFSDGDTMGWYPVGSTKKAREMQIAE